MISCANAIFPSPADCVFFGVQYLFYQLLSHLGAEKYESCFSSESATGDGMLIICRSAIRHRVAGIESLPITRTIKTSDPDWLKRAQYASNAHREVLKKKNRASLFKKMGLGLQEQVSSAHRHSRQSSFAHSSKKRHSGYSKGGDSVWSDCEFMY